MEVAVLARSVCKVHAGCAPKVALCTGTYMRTWQLLDVLAGNVLATWPYRAQFTWFVVDFNTDPGENQAILQGILTNCAAAWKAKHIRLFRCPVQGWHASKCKNTTHMVPIRTGHATLTEMVLVNVDNDNVITTTFLEAMCSHAPALADGSLGSLRFEGADGGVTGRVALGAVSFIWLGGYDEEMLPMGYQDIDIWRRAGKFAPRCIVEKGPDVGRSIPNLPKHVLVANRGNAQMIAAKVANVEPIVNPGGVAPGPMSWAAMNKHNTQLAKAKAARPGELGYKRNVEAPFLGHPDCEEVVVLL